MTTSRTCLIGVVGVVAFALSAAAAEPARDLALMRVATNAEVYVRTSNGAEIAGRFVRASTGALVITRPDGRETTLTSDQVMVVWKRGDSVLNGAIIGGLIGLAGGILGQSQCTECASEVAIGIGLGVPIWAGVGALVDRQRVGRTVIYRSP